MSNRVLFNRPQKRLELLVNSVLHAIRIDSLEHWLQRVNDVVIDKVVAIAMLQLGLDRLVITGHPSHHQVSRIDPEREDLLFTVTIEYTIALVLSQLLRLIGLLIVIGKKLSVHLESGRIAFILGGCHVLDFLPHLGL